MSSTESAPSTPRLSLICPTIGRSTFRSLLEDVLLYLGEGDEFIVVGDGPCPNIRELIEAAGDARVRYLELPARVGDWGCTPCDVGIANATGDVVWFVGDDDQVASHVFDIVRAGVTGLTDKVHIFSMKHTGSVFRDTIQFAKVSGQQIVHPRARGPRMADFPLEEHYRTDWVYIDRCVEHWGPPIFHGEIICILPHMNQGKMC